MYNIESSLKTGKGGNLDEGSDCLKGQKEKWPSNVSHYRMLSLHDGFWEEER